MTARQVYIPAFIVGLVAAAALTATTWLRPARPKTTRRRRIHRTDSLLVYVTEHGGRYHHHDCALLHGRGIAMPVDEASQGRTPCPVCFG